MILSRILQDKTMSDKLMYITNDDTQNQSSAIEKIL